MTGIMDETRLRARLTTLCRDAGVPGIAVSIHTPGQRLDAAVGHRDLAATQPLDNDASFELGCVVKPLLAAATIRLARLGRLGLDDRAADHLPELGGTAYGRDVRLAQLLSHTSGYAGTGLLEGPDGLDRAGLVERLARAPRLFRPGTVFSYEHSETVLLGAVLTALAGASPASLVASLVLDPAGVAADGGASAGRHGVDGRGRMLGVATPRGVDAFWQPAFALALSMPGLARAAADLLARGRQRLLATMLDGALVLPPMIAGPACPELPLGFGRGIARFRGGWLGANGIGAGQSVALRLHPALGIVVAVGVNVLAPGLRDALVGQLCRECASVPDAPPPRVDAPLDVFAGDYLGGGDGFVRALATAQSLELEIGSRRAPRRLRARMVRAGPGLDLLADVPHLAVGLSAPDGAPPWLMLGLTAFGRAPLCASKDEI